MAEKVFRQGDIHTLGLFFCPDFLKHFGMEPERPELSLH
jgi:hypothetical protein